MLCAHIIQFLCWCFLVSSIHDVSCQGYYEPQTDQVYDFPDNYDEEVLMRSFSASNPGRHSSEHALTKYKNRIVGGFAVEIKEYPYNAQFAGCGAAILASTWCITAAHCNSKTHAVKVGATKWGSGSTHPIEQYIPHPQWGKRHRNRFEYDFQLLKLRIPIKFSANAQPISIGTLADAKPGKYLVVTGWGRTRFNGHPSDTLRAVHVPIVSRDTCERVRADNYRYISPLQLCAGFTRGGRDACQGDSGGPAVSSNGQLVGLVSYGFNCALPRVYGVYSFVPAVVDWIKETMGSDYT